MKSALTLLLVLFSFSSLYSQDILSTYDAKTTLTSDQCFDIIKNVWDELKKISEDYTSQVAVKSEFESTAEFNDRVRKDKNQFVLKVLQFSEKNKLSTQEYSVWMKAELVKYDADKQVYSVKCPTQILVQPSKDDIAVACPVNKYVSIEEKDEKGYRRAFIQLKTDPEFSWFVNKITAQSAKNKEQRIFFKLSFSFNTLVNEKTNQIVLQLIPHKLALMDQSENFVYWSEDIR